MFLENLKIKFLLFMIYSVIGWILEVIDQLYRQKKFINRGFLIGPYCPVHGVGALMMLQVLTPLSDSFIVLFISSTLICSILEFFTSLIFEKIFKARWWDYSNFKFNLDGRICLQYSLFFGVAGVFIVKFANPFIMHFIYFFKFNFLNILAPILFLIFITDLCISTCIIYKFNVLTNKLTKDNTEEISLRVKNILAQKSPFFRRLVNVLPIFGRSVKKISLNIINIFNITK